MEIGLILGAFGIKGEVRIKSLNVEPERFLELESLVLVRAGEDEKVHRIESIRVQNGVVIAKLESVTTRTDAEALKRARVQASDDCIIEVDDAESEADRLIGLEVFTTAGDRLGVIEEVILTGANDVYEVRDGKKTVLLPAIDDVVKSVDLDTGRMVVELLPGLL
jgi:16S rRNA processing protein RimM